MISSTIIYQFSKDMRLTACFKLPMYNVKLVEEIRFNDSFFSEMEFNPIECAPLYQDIIVNKL